MKEIFVLVEHRQGEIMDVTYELLAGGAQLALKIDARLTAVYLGSDDKHLNNLKNWAHKIISVKDDKLKNFNSEAYQCILSALWKEHKPYLTLIPQSGFGIDLAPSLAVDLDIPMIPDCFEIHTDNGSITASRQMYGGKVTATVGVVEAPGYILTIRPTSFAPENSGLSAGIDTVDSPLKDEIAYRRFVKYLTEPAGDVDITQADVVIGVGRGIKEKENLRLVEELARVLGGVLACSRPIVDAGWLGKDRQVGSSGKTIKPKLYIAIGISGSFQHITGIMKSETVIAINKDPNAPIFGEADYGIVGDLFKVVPVLTKRINDYKTA